MATKDNTTKTESADQAQDKTQHSPKYQARETAAIIAELYRTTWFIAAGSKLMSENESADGSLQGVAAEGIFDAVIASADKQMGLIEDLEGLLSAKPDFDDLHTKVFVYKTPASKTNHDESRKAKFSSAVAEGES